VNNCWRSNDLVNHQNTRPENSFLELSGLATVHYWDCWPAIDQVLV